MDRKMCSKHGENRNALRFRSSEATDQHLEEIKVEYAKMIGREISLSLVVRRAFDLLALHLKEISGDSAAMNTEQAALLRHIR